MSGSDILGLFQTVFSAVVTFFDRIFMDTGYYIWAGSAFLMFLGYRFLIRPIFGSGGLGSIGSDNNKAFSKQQKDLYSWRYDEDGNAYKYYW